MRCQVIFVIISINSVSLDAGGFHCDEASCERTCLFGHLLTEHGCISCQCYNPCTVVICPEGMGCDVNVTSCSQVPCFYKTFCYPLCQVITCLKTCKRYVVNQFFCQTCECDERMNGGRETSP